MTAPPDKRPPNEIEAEPFRDYKPTPAKGEPFMAPGGMALIIGLVVTALLFGYWRNLVEPWVTSIVSTVLPVSK